MRLSFLLGLPLLSLFLVACGGGGGGSSGVTIAYSGNSNPVSISTTNAADLVLDVLGGDIGSKAIAPLEQDPAAAVPGRTHLLQRLAHNIAGTLPTKSLPSSTGVLKSLDSNVSDTVACATGNIGIRGTLSDSGRGTLNVTYNGCLLSGETMDGVVTVTVNSFDFTALGITDASMRFSNLSLRGTGYDLGMSGNILLQRDFSANTETLTLDVVTQDNDSKAQTKTENYIVTTVYDDIFNPNQVSVTYSGRLFDSTYGYMDVSTTTPLLYNLASLLYPGSGGPILITGALGSRIKVNVLSSNDITLYLDLDGDSSFESTRVLAWMDLFTTVGSSLGDTDGDGMHDGWELAYMLDPNDPADAAMDPDLDGATNLQEYQGRTNPTSPVSTPPIADLSIRASAIHQVLAGILFEYTVSLTNLGPDTATNIQVTDILPAGISVQNITTTGYPASCGGSSTITCTIPTLNSGGIVTITISVTASTAGTISNAVTVTSDVIDVISSNNSAMADVEVLSLGTVPVNNTTGVPAWTTYQGNVSHDGHVPITLDPGNFSLRWSTNVFSGEALNPVVAAEGTVFVSQNSYFGMDQTIAALDARDGSVIWSRGYGNIHSIDPPAYLDGKVYFQTGGHGDSYLRALNAVTGALIYESAYGNQWSRYFAPTPFENDIYISGGSYGGAYGFDANDGTEKWFTGLNQYDEWTPAVDLNYVYTYTGDNSPELRVLDRFSGQTVFSIPDPSFYWNGWSMDIAPVLGGNQDILVTNGGRLISFDLQNQDMGWELAGNYTGQVSVASGRIFVSNGGVLNVLDESTGALQWTWAPPASGSISGNMIVTTNLVFLQDGTTTYAIDLSTHLSVWSYPAAGHLVLGNEGALYIATSSGTLIAITVSGDTDADGMPDWWESNYGLLSTDPSDANGDLDSDGLNNLQEYLHTTNPLLADTDGDGINDADEVNVYASNPKNVDTDDDGLSDGVEILTYMSNPTVMDTDLDGINDGDEVNLYGTDPTDATSVPQPLTAYNESFENPGLPAGWVASSGNFANWSLANTSANTGSRSLRSGTITDSQQSGIKYTNLFAAGTLSFSARVDAESCCDKLKVYVDGALSLAIPANSAWTQYQINLTSSQHTVEWRYEKDASGAAGADAAWIDDIVYTSP